MSQYPITVAVDLDDTIADASAVKYPEIGPPKKGARRALQILSDLGCVIRIYTCRLNAQSESPERQLERVTNYLRDQRIPHDDIVLAPEGKPFADFYIDDKAVRLTDWTTVLPFVIGQVKEKLQSRTASEAMIAHRVACRTLNLLARARRL